ncbi:hypothetical protein BJV85_000151 [Clostridium acetobutylicum]|uniref:UPF0182 protein CA_C0010 n=1 Tax=Clostridium acetobutylicum (strain ATCC 824 / DSM 792 / JCM 1419 / IAM 19013 / LMG 5710 / NBRC 13948 / NRRL B-527 / VKM B-1787 / 2291 / W) TaxID=272562 RepID=Y010_CLOAB|nr:MULTISPECIES: UPF0182 family protein [Clostridium]Q97N28.1 RecName: Full=UPF0182 protein CA_C0010 [Clostridium acetobutylicum ATCC 824]AAK77997.1 Uncharacterized conserved protein, possible metal-binding [Clostridium acetobutylicum ATCC 824]ADZ19053.1 Conserved hypothetical protein [Clostridium acetobutylicum EA 2018]AEI31009.1 hypothetical protein SMB_G0010 [Clostridium acetobutylicum DSM 1731]AWV81940.1 hypothetical protein DK921_18025 [Clostridium acetobutylicum]MBC2395490.1 UPF0182 fam
MKKKVTIVTIILFLLVIVGSFGKVTDFIINLEWFKEIGYTSVYFTKLAAILKLMIPIFIIIYTGLWFYYKSIRKIIIKWNKVVEVNVKTEKLKKRVAIVIDVIASFFVAYFTSSVYWYRILQFTSGNSFNIKDPIFNLDVSFYVFRLPLIESLYGVMLLFLIFMAVLTVILYIVLSLRDRVYNRNIGGINISFKEFFKGLSDFAGRQFAIISGLIMFLVAVGYAIRSFNLVYSPRGVVYGGGYTDIHVSLVFYVIIIAAAIVSSVVIFTSIIKYKIKPIFVSIVAILILIIGQSITAEIVQNLIVKSNEKNLEAPYIKNNIEYTRKAFNIDKLSESNFPSSDSLTQADIDSNRDTVNNIKVNSVTPALEFYNQVQVVRYYYDFRDLDVDRYNIGGKYSEVFLAPREIDSKSLEGNADTWQNRHLIYTHGYGLVMSKVNSVTSEGQPNFVIKDIPPQNSTNLKITNPRIYYGEETDDYAIANNTLGEFDYPDGSKNKTNNYDGKGGIKANILNRLIFAINKRDSNFLLSENITSNSKILINRNIMDRLNKIAPFLSYDKDPYVVLSGGKLFWIVDAYTTSDRFPYSQPYNNVNYIRNSVKVVIDAVDGTTNFYIVDKNDPIANSYSKIFPGLFKDVSQVPKDIRSHFKYPEDLFSTQCNVLGKYHVTDTGVFYNSEDLWETAKNQKQINGEKGVNDASYFIMRLPGENKSEMVLMEYFNMKDKDNMSAIFGARMDGNNYGKLILYKLPTDKTVYSPYLFKQKLNQDPSISKEVSLWNTQGSSVQFGDTSIIPIKNSLLYVEPVYLRAQGKNSMPEVKRVIVSFGNKMVMANSIDEALNQIFNNSSNNQSETRTETGGTSTDSSNNKDKLKQAQDLYNQAVDAQKNGDWSKYGDYINKLGKTLDELNK